MRTGTGADQGNRVVHTQTRDGVAIVTVANPPVNALVRPVRAALFAALDAALADPQVGAIVLGAEGRTFPAGTDVREVDQGTGTPSLSALCSHIEALSKPVIAAIHGTALGGGCELALACHLRVAEAGAELGFPEINLGVVPAAGGTQRLPRLVGAGTALDMLLSGRSLGAKRAAALGLVDRLVDKDPGKAAFAEARNLAQAGRAVTPTRDRRDGFSDAPAYLAAVAAKRAQGGLSSAAMRVVELVEAALLLPFEAALEMERVAYEDLVRSDTARALRHAFLADRRAARAPGLAGAAAKPLHHIAILGAGPGAQAAALAALSSGAAVTVALEDDPAIEHLRPRLQTRLGQAVEAGQLSSEARDHRLARLATSRDYGALREADLVLEMLPGGAARKAPEFARIATLLRPDAIIASGSTDGDAEALARVATVPGRFALFHLPVPVEATRLAEIAPLAATSAETVATLIRFARALGRRPVLTAPTPGLAANRLRQAYYTAAGLLIEGGARPGEVDAAMRAFGCATGPCQAQDATGIDTLWGVTAQTAATRVPLILIDNAWYGRRTGQGFYRYDADGVARTPDAFVDAVAALPDRVAISPTERDARALRRRCLFAMANEGARLLAEGVLARPSDVDVALIHTGLVPRSRGGAMFQADLAGAVAVRKALAAWSQEHAFWTPQPLWQELIKSGQSLEAMSAA